MHELVSQTPFLWGNTHYRPAASALQEISIGLADIEAADKRLRRWAPALTTLFPELCPSGGLIESALLDLPSASSVFEAPLPGRALIKADHALPVAGSIKARGGIYEVLTYAETVGVENGLLTPDTDPMVLITPAARELFSRYRIGVGSTGNLGLSIGIMASALGFQTIVHMSSDAKEWKKQRLRDRSVQVVEHKGDYASAVAAGRQDLNTDPYAHFVDDENSMDLLMGYSVAALRLKAQLEDKQIVVDTENPLFVYLPCGVGGAPAGITIGLKQIYGDTVHCFFAEPTASPAFLLRMMLDESQPVYAFGLDNKTEADGLAVAQASELAFSFVKHLTSGLFTVTDDELFEVLVKLEQETGLKIEPSAAAGFLGPKRFRSVKQSTALTIDPANITHLFWTTGGSFVPKAEYKRFYEKGVRLVYPS